MEPAAAHSDTVAADQRTGLDKVRALIEIRKRIDRRLRLGRHQLLLRADGDIEVGGVFVILLLGWP
jgi:hypothetical protein